MARRMMVAALMLWMATVARQSALSAPTETEETFGGWTLKCSVDVLMDRKACRLVYRIPDTLSLLILPDSGMTGFGAGNMRPTRVVARVDAQPGMETLVCARSYCEFSRLQSLRLTAYMLSGRALTVRVESPRADQQEELSLDGFPAALAALRRENAGIAYLDPPPPPDAPAPPRAVLGCPDKTCYL